MSIHALALLFVLCLFAVPPASAQDVEPRFTENNLLLRPQGYREWIFIGATLGMSYEPSAEKRQHPKFHNLYINPSSYREYRKTGRFPDRTIIAMEVLTAGSRESINQQLQEIIDLQTEPWGVKVRAVEVKQIDLPQDMQRAMARQAEAEREKRSKVIHAEGEFQASTQLARAAEVVGTHPLGAQLRYLQTLTEIATEKNSTIIFPLPLDLVKPFLELHSGKDSSND